MKLFLAIAALAALIAIPAVAQTRPDPDADGEQPTRVRPLSGGDQVGHVATSSVGQVGQRMTTTIGIQPMARIENRINNRIENRINNRIDQNYQSTTNATASFQAAESRAQGKD